MDGQSDVNLGLLQTPIPGNLQIIIEKVDSAKQSCKQTPLKM